MSNFVIMLIVMAAIGLGMLPAWIAIMMESNDHPHDERQKKVRGEAYRDAFSMMIALLAVYAFLETFDKLDFMTTQFKCGAVITGGLCVFFGKCVLGHALNRPEQVRQQAINGINELRLFRIVFLCMVLMVVWFYVEREDVWPLTLHRDYMILVLLVYLVLWVCMERRYHLDKKEAAQDDE